MYIKLNKLQQSAHNLQKDTISNFNMSSTGDDFETVCSALEFLAELSINTDNTDGVNTYDLESLFRSPSAKLVVNYKDDEFAICDDELVGIIEDSFLEDDEFDEGKPIEDYYKDGVKELMIPKNKNKKQKYKRYLEDYLAYCRDPDLDPNGNIKSPVIIICKFFHDR